jgi:RNA polymerase sigma-70 factor, ECF subfamily
VVNGQPALIVHVDGQPFSVLTVDVEQGQIQAIRIVANPEKLTHV